MIGHEPLIAMRRRSRFPERVNIETRAVDDRRYAAEWPSVDPRHPMLLIAPDETVARLDLRCLLGLDVAVDGGDRIRVRQVFDACVDAGARRVIGTISRPTRSTHETVEMLDTEGMLTWQA